MKPAPPPPLPPEYCEPISPIPDDPLPPLPPVFCDPPEPPKATNEESAVSPPPPPFRVKISKSVDKIYKFIPPLLYC